MIYYILISYPIIGIIASTVYYYLGCWEFDEDFWLAALFWPFIIGCEICYFIKNGIRKIKQWKQGRDPQPVKKVENIEEFEKIVNMDTNKITVMVCGFTGSGKTTIARKIEEILIEAGLNVDRIVEDDEDFADEQMQNMRLKSLIKKNTDVVVKSIQLTRASLTEDKTKNSIHDELSEMNTMKVKEN